ncbi:MAG: pirin family protein [Nocardioides sp.]
MSGLQVLQPREVPLGGPRAMRVRRTLPARGRTLIGAWCFVDHYGPDDVAATRGMSVAPHPHTGLQTVSWLFTGEIEHRDSAGHPAFVRPGELNLMTAGRGISHTEVSTQRTRVLHGVQLWLALPDADRHVPPGLQHHVPERVRRDGWSLRVFLGSLDGVTAPVPTYTPLLGAELVLDAAVTVTVELDPAFEHGVLVDGGTLLVGGEQLTEHRLGYLGPGRSRLELQAVGDEPVRLLLLGAPVRREDRDVVELRRPQPRRDRRVPRGLAGADHPRRRGGHRRATCRGRPLRQHGRSTAAHPRARAAARATQGTWVRLR